jgi:signal peptidase I
MPPSTERRPGLFLSNRAGNVVTRILFLLFLGVAGAWILRTYFFETISVASGSMEPTLFVGAHYLVNRFVYHLHAPQRGDIISFRSPVDHETFFIKRVIALPGDKIELRAKQVILNGTLLDEPYTIHKRATERLDGDDLGPLNVPAGDVFVLGDNRDESFDSSVWTDPKTGAPIRFLSIKDIRGRLIQFQ